MLGLTTATEVATAPQAEAASCYYPAKGCDYKSKDPKCATYPAYKGKTCVTKTAAGYQKWVFDPNGYCKKYPFNCAAGWFLLGFFVRN
jgi:hypothetical protein